MNKIITIGREFGSGGRELGKRIAEKLGIAYYDKEIISEIAKNTELAVSYIQQIIEKKPIIYYPITVGGTLHRDYGFIPDKTTQIYAEQCKVLNDLANRSSCVIVGRCADYILRDLKPFRIFVYSDMPSKIKRCREKGDVDENLSERKLVKLIKTVDKHRSGYYSFYTSQSWGEKLNYDICINTSGKEIKDVVEEIISILK